VDGIIHIPLAGQPLACETQADGESDPRPSLRQFVAGPENRLVEVAVFAILEGRGQDGRGPHPYNPLVLYGPSGTGKSHLALGMAAEWRIRYGRRSVEVTSAVDFARELADAVETQAVDDFRRKYRKPSLVVVEDIDKLVDKRSSKLSAQEELIHTIDVLMNYGRQLVATASEAPSRLGNLLPGLQGRLTAGLSIPLLPPGLETRKALLRRLAQYRELQLPEPVVEVLAEGLQVTVSELYGALVRLEMQIRLDGVKMDPAVARRFLAERDASWRPSLRDIALAAARLFSLNLSDLRGPSRRRAVVSARNAAVYVARQLTRDSFKQIGDFLGGRDHTTVMHGYRKLETALQSDPVIREAVQQLQKKWERVH
jgi:chromosomal replication initiator protein